MNILIAIGGFLPAKNCGGPVVSISNFLDHFQTEYKCYVLTLNHELKSKEKLNGIKSGWNKKGNYDILYIEDSEVTYKMILRICKNFKIDLLYMNSFFTYRFLIPTYRVSKKLSIPLLVAPRGELCANAYKGSIKKKVYTLLFRVLIKNSKVYFQVTSQEEELQVLKLLAVPKKKTFYLSNFSAVNTTNCNPHHRRNPEKLYCLFISRIQKKKNLIKAIQILQKVKSSVCFDIYGPIEDTEYWKLCQKEIKLLPANIECHYCGSYDHEKIFFLFSQYDLLLFPTYSENFGHVITEALSSGCPVLISDQTPWSDLNTTGGGYAIKLDNEEEYVSVIEKISNLSDDAFYSFSKKAINYYTNRVLNNHLKDDYCNAIYAMVKGSISR
jgi:glycosyltransferase involved in cell wall biosynthesis